MRLHYGAPPADTSFVPLDEGWNKLREPGALGLQILAVPVMIGTLMALVSAWKACAPDAFEGLSFTIKSDSDGGKSTGLVVAVFTAVSLIAMGVLTLIAVHELLHVSAFPKGGTRFIGVWPSRLLFYAAFHGSLSRNRFLWVLIVPFLVLTITPLIAAAVMRTTHGLIAVVSILNGAFSCGDLLGMALIAAQVPASAEVRNQGWETWWREGKAESGNGKAEGGNDECRRTNV